MNPPVAFDLFGGVEILGEAEMQVALQGVAEDDGFVVAEAPHDILKVQRGFGEPVDGEGHVLDDHRGAGFAHGAHRREEPLADVPQDGVLRDPVGEGEGPLEGDPLQGVGHRADLPLELFGRVGPGFHQQGGGRVGERLQVARHPRLVLDRPQGGAVHEFDRGHRLVAQNGRGGGGALDLGEDHEGARLAGVFNHGLIGDLGDEPQRALRADHQVQQDVEGVLEVHQGVEAEAGGVLDLVFASNALRQGRVGTHLLAEGIDRVEQVLAGVAEFVAAGGVGGVEQGAVLEKDAHAGDRAVAVLGGAAAHAARVVGGDAADHGRVDGGRVGADLAAVGGQIAVGVAADHTGLQPDAPAVVDDRIAVPAAAGHDEHRVGHRLAREACPRGAKGDRGVRTVRGLQNSGDFGFRVGAHDDLGDQPIKAGVRAVGEGAQRVRE